jgi:squalene synthase HpnC
LPKEPFEHLIRAFELDQTKTRYETYGEVLDYCVYSANPVGRLVLALGGYRDAERLALSDSICTALQLVNHWQDVRRDFFDRDRIYLPAELMARYGYSYEALEADLGRRRGSTPARELVQDLTDRAHALFDDGAPLPATLDRRLAIDIELFRQGGLAILEKIRRQEYDVIARRPKIGKLQRVGLVMRVLASRLFARSGGAAPIAESGARE